ncbi:hypothetical protein SAMN04487905_105252 [Actinopolyspora xinjiangensis]|uniref:Uncharacterized protein n=1 Tax=Actinopolyspora xinjiangensis TaxID=405564 RepID=A0A1H0TS70_9ACTN|nr:hypothetical protein [Actinopolyspora xinjiangensis]SDP56867.1 hypothetical protein SAMN04487905_105252 [Actinopolyspora xinjiangensis]
MATPEHEIFRREEDLSAARFRFVSEELPISDRDRLVSELARETGDRASTMLGFQVNETPKDFRRPDALLRYHASNAGDPEVDVGSLVRLVEFFAARGHSVVVNFDYGATSNGAFDDVERVCRALRPVLVEHGMYGDGGSDRRYWFHMDGAFGAAYMPYPETGFERGMTRRCGPVFDFRVPRCVRSCAVETSISACRGRAEFTAPGASSSENPGKQ